MSTDAPRFESVALLRVPQGQRITLRDSERIVSVVPGDNGMLLVGIATQRPAPESHLPDETTAAERAITEEGR